MSEKHFNGIKDKNRNKTIIKVSLIGIITNAFLALFKAIIGFITGSIAIILDAVNNLSDTGSSLITIIGTKLASKKPDKEHPFGHGRIEYLSAMLISIIVLYAGLTSFIETIKAIINPKIPEYNTISLIIIFIAVFIKIILGIYVKNKGKKLNSSSLINSGNDAILDSIISTSTLIAAIIFLIFNISLEAYLGAIISIIIIKSGVNMLKSAISSILGERVDPELIKNIKKTIFTFEDINGVYDLTLNNYGPNSFIGSVHIEIPDTYTADKIDELSRKITNKIYEKYNVILAGIGIYSVNTKNQEVISMRENIIKILNEYKNVIQMHGFYLDKFNKIIRFDVVISFDEKDSNKLYQNIYDKLINIYPGYKIIISFDTDFSVS